MATRIYKATVYGNHNHLAYLDIFGNGVTSNNFNHVHKIVRYQVQVAKNHIHQIIRK